MSYYCFKCEAAPGFLGFRGPLARDLLAMFGQAQKKGFLIQIGNGHYKLENPGVLSILSETRVWALMATSFASWLISGPIVGWQIGKLVAAMVSFMSASTINHLFSTSLLPEFVDPRTLNFAQDSISSRFHDDFLVIGPPRSEQPQIAVVAITLPERPHFTELFAVNNRSLFNAAHNGVKKVRVFLVDVPSSWASRFTCAGGGRCITVRADPPQQQAIRIEYQAVGAAVVNIPASSLNPDVAQGMCFVVLEARNLVKPQRSETLFSILQEFSADINIQQVEGERSYARIRVDQQDAELIKNIIKAIGKQRGKKVEVRAK